MEMFWKYTMTTALILGTCLLECSSENAWDIRLLDGPHIYEGRVEVYFGRRGWFGTCDMNWGMEEAIVVCRQLGYPGASASIPYYSIETRGRVLLSRDWQCTGNEESLWGCNNYIPTALCPYHAGVICHGPGYLGCYQDTFGALTSALYDNMLVERDTMTVERCKQFCMSRHFRIVGLKNGDECYCGLTESELDNHPKLSDAECQAPCSGNNRTVCGGYRTHTDKLSVFDVNMGDCVNPGEPDHGFALDNGYKFGDIVRYDCMPGYELIGVHAIQCILAPGGPGMGVIWSTSVPTCAVIRMTNPPMPSEATTITPTTTTKPTTTMPETTTTKKPTTVEPMRTTTEQTTVRDTTTMESVKMTLTERTTTEEIRRPMDATSTAMTPPEETTSSMTRMTSTVGRSTEEIVSDKGKKTTTMVDESVNDVTNYTDFITEPTKSSRNQTLGKGARKQPFNLFTMLSEHSILIAIAGTILLLLIPIIIIVIVKKSCKRKKSPAKIQIERSMDYQLGSETTGFTYEPQPGHRGRYQSFRKGFKRFSKRPWSDREEDSSDEEL